jgi:hypothetical protein
LRQGLAAATAAVNAMSGSRVTIPLMQPVLAVIRTRYGFQTLVPVEQNGVWWVEGQINPRSRERTRKQARVTGLTPQQLGALLEPILARAEQQLLQEAAQNSSRASREGVRRAERDIARGGTRPGSGVTNIAATVSRENEVALIRRVNTGAAPVGAHTAGMRADMAYTDGELQGGFTYFNTVGNTGTLHVLGADRYDGTIPGHVATVEADIRRRNLDTVRRSVGVADGATPTAAQQAAIDAQINRMVLASLSVSRQRLTRSVEPVRSPGMLVARRSAEILAETGHATPAEITHGNLNPMAFQGASGDAMNNLENQSQRHARLGALIQRLRDTAQRATILAEPGGPELRRIGDSIENWLRSNARQAANPNADPRATESANRRLVDAFMQFLRTFQGGR